MIEKTREELEKLPLSILRNIDIKNIDREKMIQEIILSKTSRLPPIIKFDRSQIPDIKNKAEEDKWQKKIDDFNQKNNPVQVEIVSSEKELLNIQKEVELENPKDEINQGKVSSPFCDKCDSRGVRHKKVCPNYSTTVKSNADVSSETI